jgi:hypothetical protein
MKHQTIKVGGGDSLSDAYRRMQGIIDRGYRKSMLEYGFQQALRAEQATMQRKNPPKLTAEATRALAPRPSPMMLKVQPRRIALLKRLTGEWQRQVDICAAAGIGRMTTVCDIDWLAAQGLVETRRVKELGRTYIEVRAK